MLAVALWQLDVLLCVGGQSLLHPSSLPPGQRCVFSLNGCRGWLWQVGGHKRRYAVVMLSSSRARVKVSMLFSSSAPCPLFGWLVFSFSRDGPDGAHLGPRGAKRQSKVESEVLMSVPSMWQLNAGSTPHHYGQEVFVRPTFYIFAGGNGPPAFYYVQSPQQGQMQMPHGGMQMQMQQLSLGSSGGAAAISPISRASVVNLGMSRFPPPTHASHVKIASQVPGSMHGTCEARWRAFDAFSTSHAFELVLDELNLEHVAQLMMCCRSLREIGERAKDWGGAVRELSRMNHYNLCDFCEKATLPYLRSPPYIQPYVPYSLGGHCNFRICKLCDDEICGFEEEAFEEFDWIEEQDPRIPDANFASRPSSVQFGLLFSFQRMCVEKLQRFYGLHGLAHLSKWKCDHGYPLDILEQVGRVRRKCPLRYIMFQMVATLGVAVYQNMRDCRPVYIMSTFKGKELDQERKAKMSKNTIYSDTLMDFMVDLCDMATDSGTRFCSDVNFKYFIEAHYMSVPGLGSKHQDAVNVMGHLRANFDMIVAGLEPLPTS